MAVFEKRSEMPVSRDALFAYHARPGAIDRLIPPYQNARVVERAGDIRDGARVTIRMLAGPLWKDWTAEHFDYVEGRQFRDRQVRGPMRSWTHTHRFEDGATPGTSVLIDHVEYEPPLAMFSGGYVHRKLECMFAFRHARTRNDLRRHTGVARQLKVAVTGSRGGIGSNLVPFLTTAGHDVLRVTHRNDGPAEKTVPASGGQPSPMPLDEIQTCDALIHLAGQNIATRWTRRRWREIESSRVDFTRRLCESITRVKPRINVLVCASAVGFYGDRGDEELTEDSPRGSGRAAELCERWEAACQPARDAGIRVVNLRIGVVLSARTGALPKMLTPARLGLGGPVGGGRQWMSWVAMDDVVAVIDRAIRDERLSGPVNAVTDSVRQREFAETLGRVLRRPGIAPTPALAINTLFGEMGRELLLASARVEPTRLREAGFAPTWPTLEGALRFELGKMEGVTP